MSLPAIKQKSLRIVGLIAVFLIGVLTIISTGGGDLYISPCFPFPCPTETPLESVPPTAPGQLVALPESPSIISLTWQESTDNDLVVRYEIYRDEVYIGLVAADTTAYASTGLAAETRYCYKVIAVDRAGNESLPSNEACATTLTDTEPPSVPLHISATYIEIDDGTPAINAVWSSSTDDGILAGYKLYRDSAYLVTLEATHYADSMINPLTEYCYAVLAYDNSGNESALSDYACAVSSWLLSIVRKDAAPEALSIDADAGNGPHVLFTQDKLVYNPEDEMYTRNKYLKYYRKYSGWVEIEIDSFITDELSNNGKFTSPNIRFDSNNHGHVGYIDHTSRELKYLFMGDGYWTRSTAADNEQITGSSLAADADGHAHFGYIGSGEVKYATNRSGEWETAIVEDTENTAKHPSIAIDQDNVAHIAYFEDYNSSTGGAIKYATNEAGSWATTVVEELEAGADSDPSIVADSGGGVHIIYFDADDNRLVQATRTNGAWSKLTVNDSVITSSNSVYIDASNKLHISYTDYENHILMYSDNTSGQWEAYTIDARSYVHNYNSIAIDSDGDVHLVYRGDEDLRYATTKPTN